MNKDIEQDIQRAKEYLDRTREEFLVRVKKAQEALVEEYGALCGQTIEGERE